MTSRRSANQDHFPLSPPWSAGSSPYYANELYAMAPPTPYVQLPPCYDHYHPQPSSRHGLITPPPSPARVHQALSSSPTVVRYDFAADPATLRMSSSSPLLSFPSHDSASSPSASVLHIRCQVTGQMITVHNRNGVTCLDLLVQLHCFFDEYISPDDWRSVRGPQRDAMKEAYERRTGRLYAPSSRMKRVDHLLGQSKFKQLSAENTDASGPTWLLQTY